MPTTKIKVSLDGGATWIDAPQGVKVDFAPSVTFESEGRSLIASFTPAGMAVDVYADTRAQEQEHTLCVPHDELIDFFVGSGP